MAGVEHNTATAMRLALARCVPVAAGRGLDVFHVKQCNQDVCVRLRRAIWREVSGVGACPIEPRIPCLASATLGTSGAIAASPHPLSR